MKIRILSTLIIIAIISIVAESIFIDKIFLFIFLISLLFMGAKEKIFLNPYNLFAVTPFSLLIYSNITDYYLLDLTHKTYTLVIINITSFVCAFSLFPRYRQNKKLLALHKQESKQFLSTQTYFLLALSLIGFILPSLQSIFWLFSIAGISCALKNKDKKMIMIVIVYVLITGYFFISKMRVLLFLIIFLLAFERIYNSNKRKSIWIKILPILSVCFLVYAFSFANKERGDYDAEEGVSYFLFENRNDQNAKWNYEAGLFLPYMYMITPWANLQHVTETQNNRTNGLWMLKPIINYLQFDDYLKEEYTLIPYSSFNTFTFIAVGFKDFGYWLSIIPTLILGAILKKVYTMYLQSNSAFDFATYSVFALATVEMFFSNHYYMVSYPFTMLILMWIYKAIIRQQKKR